MASTIDDLGHLSLGHTKGGAWVIDTKIDVNADDEDEKAANRFALELITGDPGCKIVPAGRHLNKSDLANAALSYGASHQIDPLHIALNYGYNSTQWAVAAEAVKLIAKDKDIPTDQSVLVQALLASVDLDAITEDDLAALKRFMQE